MLIKQKNNIPRESKYEGLYLIVLVIEVIKPLIGCGEIESRAVAIYIQGLIRGQNKTITGIAEEIGIISHDEIRRMLQKLVIGVNRAALIAVKLITIIGGEGYLIIDDVLIPKPFCKMIAYCGWDWDHSSKRNVFGQRLVFLVWSNGWLTIPLLFMFWQKDPNKPKKPKKKGKGQRGRKKKPGRKVTDYSLRAKLRRARYKAKQRVKHRKIRLANGVHIRSKNELARIMCWKIMRAGLRVDFILFDNWYASKENFLLFERLGLKWVTRVKDNAKVDFNGEVFSVKKLAASIKYDRYHYYNTGLRMRQFLVSMDGRLRKLTVIKNDTSSEKGHTKYLLTNAISLTNQEHLLWYRNRWSIELFFRDCKQELGFCNCEARNDQIIIAHILLVCVAFIFLQFLRSPNDQRPSIKTSKKLVLLLVLFYSENPNFIFLNNNGDFIPLAFDKFLLFRWTGFPIIKKPLSCLLS